MGEKLETLGTYRVQAMIDVHSTRRGVRICAGRLGFDRIASAELTIVASELCTNIVKYGVRGVLYVERVVHPTHGVGLLLSAEDEGPAFADFEKAVRDRSDDRGTIPPELLNKRSGIAAGLGAVQRLTHRLWTEPTEGGKKRVVAVRYLTSRLRTGARGTAV